MDPKVQEERTRAANEREQAQFDKVQRRLGELVRIRLLLIRGQEEELIVVRHFMLLDPSKLHPALHNFLH